MTFTALIIEKNGSIKEVNIKSFNEEELYKKAGFKTPENFEKQTEWGAEIEGNQYSISIYGKTVGRAGQENKYEFPPPIDNVLFFGNCILINKKEKTPINITKEEWKHVYEFLYGGFEDIGDEDSEESSEDEDENLPKTKQGYVKDDFIVDDDEDDDEDYTEEESEEEIMIKKIKKNIKKNVVKPNKKSDKKNDKKKVSKTNSSEIENKEETYLDCTSELVEEDYIE